MNPPSLTRPAPSPLRSRWRLKPDVVFLNHGSFGACPGAILDIQTRFREEMEAEPVQFLWRRYEERLEPSRTVLASFIGAQPRDVVFVGNATVGVNAVLRSVPLKLGDELLTTNFAYNACRNALIETSRRAGARVVIAELPYPLRTADQAVEAILRAATPRTRLAMIDHVTSDTGVVLPIEVIVRELAGLGVDTLVDGAHAPGMVALDLEKNPRPAYYTGNLHKWVCAPKGAGFLWVREDRQEALQPPVISHGNNRPRTGYTPFQDRFDWQGTIDPSPWFCVGEAIRWMQALLPGGWTALRERNRELAVAARQLLCARFEVDPACPESMLGSLATVRLPERFQGKPAAGKIDSEQLELYDRFAIEVPFSRVGQPPVRYLRISAQIYNELADYQFLADAVEALP
jgi:isopenicillin-N epimerase